MRYMCHRCSRIVYERGTGPQRQHQCARQQDQPDPRIPIKCDDCFGFHTASQPCFIQPVNANRLNSMLRRFCANQGFHDHGIIEDSSDSESSSISSEESENEEDEEEMTMDMNEDVNVVDTTKPYRFFVFDVECSQDEEARPGQFKHKPMLICAEMICTECINAGIIIGGVNNQNNINIPRPVGCVCKGGDRMMRRFRGFVVPETEGRCFRFDNFDDAGKNPIDDMLDFLTKRAPQNSITIALSHNG